MKLSLTLLSLFLSKVSPEQIQISSPKPYTPYKDCYAQPVKNVPYDKNGDGFIKHEGFACPKGEWCRLEQRINWRPLSDNYMTRGRCEKFKREGESCLVPRHAATEFTGLHLTDSGGKLIQRPLICDPEDLICTGDTILVIPPTCVKKRPRTKCYTNEIKGWHSTKFDPENIAEAPGRGMWCPSSEKTITRQHLEHAARYFVGMNGENQIIKNLEDLEESYNIYSRPKVWNFYGGGRKETWKLANEALKSVWPFPVCSTQDSSPTSDCTHFPIKPISADALAGHMGYIYLWTVFHTIAHNLPLQLTPAQLQSIDTLVILTQQFMSCVFCRANFEEIVNTVKLPSHSCTNGLQVAKWFWLAHNNANEHSRITHRVNDELECKLDKQFCLGWKNCQDKSLDPGYRCNGKGKKTVFENPDYTSPWYLSWEDAVEIWTISK